ncbi:dienelactone hydrolase family protein [Bradyrhizobium erythrophlei]|uniref:dienelactone hydrolase family protein n=1 Tax=Bradyrhizobium erythrophlei TaxID=1437360 RepID=UPI0035E66B05
MNFAGLAALLAAFLAGIATSAIAAEQPPTLVEIENPLASTHPLQGYLRRSNSTGPLPAVVLLHGCNGNWGHIDERWGRRIASWGYVTLSVDSFGPRGLNNCGEGVRDDLTRDAYRALDFLVRDPFVDPARVAVIGFAHGGRVALMSVERGLLEQTSPSKFHAAVAFYPPCLGFNGIMTAPTLILAGERDDWNLARECRNLVDGRDDWGISRQKGEGFPMKLIVYPGAYHGFDAPALETPRQMSGHHLEFNQAATDQAAAALREFLDATIGPQERPQ